MLLYLFSWLFFKSKPFDSNEKKFREFWEKSFLLFVIISTFAASNTWNNFLLSSMDLCRKHLLLLLLLSPEHFSCSCSYSKNAFHSLRTDLTQVWTAVGLCTCPRSLWRTALLQTISGPAATREKQLHSVIRDSSCFLREINKKQCNFNLLVGGWLKSSRTRPAALCLNADWWGARSDRELGASH